jgi:hypothetical protein
MKNWTPEWPTEPGYYWVFGDAFGVGTMPGETEPYRKLEQAKVRKISNGVLYIVSGQIAYPREAGPCVWLKIDEPELPQI